jgi:hypothetical protein
MSNKISSRNVLKAHHPIFLAHSNAGDYPPVGYHKGEVIETKPKKIKAKKEKEEKKEKKNDKQMKLNVISSDQHKKSGTPFFILYFPYS